MKITAFFSHRLSAPLHNHIWSWGAVDEKHRRVFLRIGRWAVEDYNDGKRWATLRRKDWKPSELGVAERIRHIALLRNGYDGFAIVVDFNNAGKISSFDDEALLRLGKIVDESGHSYAEVTETCPVDDIVGSAKTGSISTDLEELLRSTPTVTQRRSLIDARIGQGWFRNAVLRRWDYKCALTAITTVEAIRASHIKPWKDSTNDERLDPFNGLPLIATLDALFDNGLISFENDGTILVSPRMHPLDISKLSLTELRLQQKPPKKTREYLTYHRDECFCRL